MGLTGYDAIAEWYDENVRAGSLIHELVLPSIWELIGDVAGQHICDLACGQGIVARSLALRGATVVGVDIATRLLDIAQREEDIAPLGIIYQQDDAQTLATLSGAMFDGVVCNMALMDIPDLGAVFRAIRHILRPAGWLVFSTTHPCFQTPESRWMDEADGTVSRVVGAYFTEGIWRSDNPGGVRGQVGAYHRTLSTYIDELHAVGLVLERMREPRATDDMAVRVRGYAEIPAALVVACRKVVR